MFSSGVCTLGGIRNSAGDSCLKGKKKKIEESGAQNKSM